jgi:hypothetical protein
MGLPRSKYTPLDSPTYCKSQFQTLKPSRQALFQQLYISSLTFSVEKTATTLTQMFADPSYLMHLGLRSKFTSKNRGQKARRKGSCAIGIEVSGKVRDVHQ